MGRCRTIGVLALLFMLLAPAISAEAQIGFGIGLGSGWGSGLGGFFGGAGNHGFMGVGATISPRPVYQQPRLTPARREIPQMGQVTGMIDGCPAASGERNCSMPTELIRQMVISAIPDSGSQQWVSTQPNAQGLYQLQLPPGQYTLSVNTPDYSIQLARKEHITIRAGARIERNLKVDEAD